MPGRGPGGNGAGGILAGMIPPPPPRRARWEDLLAHPAVTETAVLGGPVGVMAFHGGLEAATAEMAEEVARATGASVYLVVQPSDLRWHVPSHRVDPRASARLAAWLDHVEMVVALHGYGRVSGPRRVLVGGGNRSAGAVVGARLAARLAPLNAAGSAPWFPVEVVTALADVPPELRGLHPDNPVNRPRRGGVQVELPPSARRPPAAAAVVEGLVDAVGGLLSGDWEAVAGG